MSTLVLFSGGLDSTVALAWSLQHGRTSALAIDYGQPHRVELDRADQIAGAMSVPLLVCRAYLPKARPGPTNVFPARNLVLLSLAAVRCEVAGHDRIVVGANADDQADYPDCRPEFFDAFERVSGVRVLAPLIQMRKAEVVRLGRSLEAPMDLSWSCYFPVGRPKAQYPCRECNACKLRAKAGA